MRVRFGWRLRAAFVAVVGATMFVINTVDFDQQSKAVSPEWLQGDARQARIDFSSLLVSLPGSDGSRSGVKIYDENNWQVYRAYPSGQLDVFFTNQSGRVERLNLAAGWRRDSYPMLIMSVPGRLIFVAYDVVRNVPSGRSLSVSQPGFDVYEMTPQTQGEPHLIAGGVDLEGGLDSIVYGRILGERITLCAEKKCADIKAAGTVKQWALDGLQGYEFVEVAFGTDSAYALVRKQWDDRSNGKITEDRTEISLAKLSPNKVSLEQVRADGIPYALVVNENKPSWTVANSAKRLDDLLLYEFSRMPNGGLMSFGDNNLEGRVAWNQVYYLHGLISIAQGAFKGATPELLDYARQRVRAEVDLIARLAGSDFPGYRVKRYSLDREPLLFALHLGRVAGLLARADHEGLGSLAVKKTLSAIKKELMSFEHTVEQPTACHLNEGGDCRTLEYRQGYPFWADGVNVPFNFVSGYVGGLLAVSDDKSSTDYAVDLMQPLLIEEKFSGLPDKWNYWAFEGQAGWDYASSKSLNTTEWAGNHAGMNVAHITYRSMDASTLLNLYQLRPDVAVAAEVDHMKQLVTTGLLLPSVNEVLYRAGEVAPLESTVAKRFARSTQAWQIQSQVWALSDLAGNNGR